MFKCANVQFIKAVHFSKTLEMASFSVGDVRPAGEHDVKVFRDLMDNDASWRKAFSKKETVVSIKDAVGSPIHMVKVRLFQSCFIS